MIFWISSAVVFSLLFVAGNAMAMAMRERTTEVAVLKAIGFNKGLLLFLVMAESILVAGAGGVLGALGCKGFCDVVDSRNTRPASSHSSTFPGRSRWWGWGSPWRSGSWAGSIRPCWPPPCR